MSQLERGVRLLSFTVLRALADVLEVSLAHYIALEFAATELNQRVTI